MPRALRLGITSARRGEFESKVWAERLGPVDSVLLLTLRAARRWCAEEVSEIVADAVREVGAVMPVAGVVHQVLRLGAAMGAADGGLSTFIDVVRPKR